MIEDKDALMGHGGYTIMPNYVLRAGLHPRAIALYALMASKPVGWKYTTANLAMDTDWQRLNMGLGSVKNAMSDLQKCGLVRTIQLRRYTNGYILGYEYHLIMSPSAESLCDANGYILHSDEAVKEGKHKKKRKCRADFSTKIVYLDEKETRKYLATGKYDLKGKTLLNESEVEEYLAATKASKRTAKTARKVEEVKALATVQHGCTDTEIPELVSMLDDSEFSPENMEADVAESNESAPAFITPKRLKQNHKNPLQIGTFPYGDIGQELSTGQKPHRWNLDSLVRIKDSKQQGEDSSFHSLPSPLSASSEAAESSVGFLKEGRRVTREEVTIAECQARIDSLRKKSAGGINSTVSKNHTQVLEKLSTLSTKGFGVQVPHATRTQVAVFKKSLTRYRDMQRDFAMLDKIVSFYVDYYENVIFMKFAWMTKFPPPSAATVGFFLKQFDKIHECYLECLGKDMPVYERVLVKAGAEIPAMSMLNHKKRLAGNTNAIKPVVVISSNPSMSTEQEEAEALENKRREDEAMERLYRMEKAAEARTKTIILNDKPRNNKR